jgi:hypothetical protein
VDNTNTDPDRRNIRVLSTTGWFDHEGNPLYYDINGMLMPSAFTDDAAGKTAMATANFFSAHIFPNQLLQRFSPAQPAAMTMEWARLQIESRISLLEKYRGPDWSGPRQRKTTGERRPSPRVS